jgi:hypothetical protein
MGIDRIGKGPPAPEASPSPVPDPERGGAGPVKPGSGAERPFAAPPVVAPASPPLPPSAAAPAGTVAAPPVALGGASALERLRAGEIDLEGYLDAKVLEATRHLVGLPAAELLAIQQALRDELATDPALSDLVTHATGKRPGPSHE